MFVAAVILAVALGLLYERGDETAAQTVALVLFIGAMVAFHHDLAEQL